MEITQKKSMCVYNKLNVTTTATTNTTTSIIEVWLKRVKKT